MKARMLASVGILTMTLSATAVEFEFDTGLEGWTCSAVSTGVDNFGASLGAMGFDYVTPTGGFDPMVISPAVSIPASREHWLVLDLNITAEASAGPQLFQIFYSTGGGFNEPQSRTFQVTPNLGWQTVVFDLIPIQATRIAWESTVVRFRIDPGSDSAALVGYRCDFDRIAITNDTDGDGIPDDDEIYWFGDIDSADETTDHDANGISDLLEISLGFNPLVDEGEVLPAASPWALAILACGLAAVAMVRWRRQRNC